MVRGILSVRARRPKIFEGPRRKPRKVGVAVRRYVKQRISGNMESKRVFISNSVLKAVNAPVITDLTSVAQGDTQFTRDGDALALQSIDLKLLCRANQTASIDNQMRIMVVQTRVEGNPVLGDFLQNTGNPQSMTSAPLAPPLLSKVLFDRLVLLDTQTTSSSRAKLVRIRLDKRKLPAKLQYDSGQTSAPKNKIFLFTWTSDNTAGPSVSVEGMTVFKDI